MKKTLVILGLICAGIYFSACSDGSSSAAINESSSTGSGTSSSGETNQTGENQSATNPDLIVTPGAKVTSGGWADQANDGAGMSYPDTDNIILISDSNYSDAVSKRDAFVKAIASGSLTSSSVTETAAIIILDGTVDLSGGLVSDSDHSYFDEFDSSHARVHNDICYEIGSNKTIIGVNSARVAFGGLLIKANANQAATNIIIRNVEFL